MAATTNPEMAATTGLPEPQTESWYGRAWEQRIQALISSPSWERLRPEERERWIDRLLQD